MPTDKEKTIAFNKERRIQLKRRTAIQKDARAEVFRLLKQAERQIKATLAAAPTEFEAFLLPQLQTSIRQTLNQLGSQLGAMSTAKAAQAFEAGVDLLDKPLAAGGVQLSAIAPNVDTAQLLAMQDFLTDKMKDVSITIANKINSELGLTVIGVQNQSQAISNIEKLLKKSGRSRAITILRTELGRVYSVANQQRKEQAAEVLPGLKKQWRRSGKVHARTHHDTADGQIKSVDKPFLLYPGGAPVELMFPRDPKGPPAETINCGCESLPIMDNWEVRNPKRKPFEPLELQSRQRAQLNDALRRRA